MPTAQVNTTALKDRATKIVTTPKTEWPVIAAEPTDAGRLYREYIAILAAIPVVSSFIGQSIVGVTVPLFGTYRVGIVTGFVAAVVSYVLALVGVYVAALVVDKLAPTFDSTPNTIQSLKLVAYASTPVWLAGVLYIIPILSPLVILAALYSIYLFYLGLPVLMKTPEAKVLPYMVVAAIVIIAVYVVTALVVGTLTALPATVVTF